MWGAANISRMGSEVAKVDASFSFISCFKEVKVFLARSTDDKVSEIIDENVLNHSMVERPC